MANLPARPKSPLPMLNARERVASAQPMASRPRDDRHPPNRSRDTYIPSYRRDDRDRDRYDRRDRFRRDWSPPSRRRDSPDRDRRPPPRGPPRRYHSPRRGSFYHSRSRSRRRGSPSPRRYRSRTRSRSRSRSPRRSPKTLRLGQHSVTNSPRSRSPLKRRPSRSRSRTPSKPLVQHSLGQETDSKSDILDASIPPLKTGQSPTKVKEEAPNVSHSPKNPRTNNITTSHPEHSPTNPITIKVESPKIKPEEACLPPGVDDDVKSEPSQVDIRWPGMDGTIIRVESPIPPTRASPRTSSTDDLSNRPFTSGLHRAPRSPPRGPRAYSSHPRGGNTYPPGNTQPYGSGPRGAKRRQVGIFTIAHKKKIYLADGESADLPVKTTDPNIEEMDKTVATTRRTAAKLALEILQQSTNLSRQLHEFQLASMDLRAAESRRKMSELHLEKARNGTLGIDYSEEPAEPKN